MSQKQRKPATRPQSEQFSGSRREPVSAQRGEPLANHRRSHQPRVWITAIILAASLAVVYIPALNAPLFFDDIGTISMNKSIVSLWPLIGTAEQPGPLRPVPQFPTAGRPLVNLSFALNYHYGGNSPWGYHVVNLLIHFCSSMLLWAIVRRTLLLPYFGNRFEAAAGWLALAVSLLWALHPLQTEAVIYVTQRTELMMACFYLATLYCSLRYWSLLSISRGENRGDELTLIDSGRRRMFWLVLAVVACACGMASKEVMVSAPLIVLLFDRAFIAGSLPKAIRQSWPLYTGLAATWLVLAWLIFDSPRSDTAGFHVGPPLVTWWMTQAEVLLIYLKLVIWPWPLLVHYQLPYVESLADAWLYLIPVGVLGFGTLFLLWRNRPVGFLGTWVFAVLSPTSVVPILTEMAAERRMYLPLAAILVILVVGGYLLIRALLERSARARHAVFDARRARNWAVGVAVAVVVLSIAASHERARAYNDPVFLWQEVIDHQPQNFVAHAGLGDLYLRDADQRPQAIGAYKEALKFNSDHLAARANLGRAYILVGQFQNAIDVLKETAKSHPDYREAVNSLGVAYARAGQLEEAVNTFEPLLKKEPDYAAAHANLGMALLDLNRGADAAEHLQRALQLQPDDTDSGINLGRALMSAGRTSEAIEAFKAALAKSPNDPVALNNFGFALIQLGKYKEAIACLELAVQIKPDYYVAHDNLGNALFHLGNSSRAIQHCERALHINPNDVTAHTNLAMIQSQLGRNDLAAKHYQEIIRIQPGFVQGYFGLAQILKLSKQPAEATAAARKGIEVARGSGQNEAADQIEKWLAGEQQASSAPGSPAPGQVPLKNQ